MAKMNPSTAFRNVLSRFPDEHLTSLESAFKQKTVLARQYKDNHGKGCLLWHLDHRITSREERLRYFADEPEASTCLVQAWDSGELSPEQARNILQEVLAARLAKAPIRKSTRPPGSDLKVQHIQDLGGQCYEG